MVQEQYIELLGCPEGWIGGGAYVRVGKTEGTGGAGRGLTAR